MEKRLADYSEAELKALLESAKKRHISSNPEYFQKFEDVYFSKKPYFSHDIFNIYRYGDFIKIVYIKSRKGNPDKKPHKSGIVKDENERYKNNISRAKARIFELAICNEFQLFCTFTQDEKMRDRFNLTEFRKDLSQFIRNKNRGRSEEDKIKYLLIPEKHKDGAWHMHGFLKGLGEGDLRLFKTDEKLPYKILNELKNGEKIYNWDSYASKFGYFTCTEIKNKTACSKYITKYVSKDLQKNLLESGQHLFFASQGLKSRERIAHDIFDRPPVDNFDYENDYIAVKEMTVSEFAERISKSGFLDTETGSIDFYNPS